MHDDAVILVLFLGNVATPESAQFTPINRQLNPHLAVTLSSALQHKFNCERVCVISVSALRGRHQRQIGMNQSKLKPILNNLSSLNVVCAIGGGVEREKHALLAGQNAHQAQHTRKRAEY